jgi:hypothetical protein
MLHFRGPGFEAWDLRERPLRPRCAWPHNPFYVQNTGKQRFPIIATNLAQVPFIRSRGQSKFLGVRRETLFEFSHDFRTRRRSQLTSQRLAHRFLQISRSELSSLTGRAFGEFRGESFYEGVQSRQHKRRDQHSCMIETELTCFFLMLFVEFGQNLL